MALPLGGKKIIAYYPQWGKWPAHEGYTGLMIPFDKITHLNYSFLTITKTEPYIPVFLEPVGRGTQWAVDTDAEVLRDLQTKFNQNRNVKLLFAIGGWTLSGQFTEASSTDARRKRFAEGCVQLLKNYPFFSGIDIDWEYPGYFREPELEENPNDTGSQGREEDKRNFALLLEAIRNELDRHWNSNSPDGRYLLTAAVSVNYARNVEVPPMDDPVRGIKGYAQFLDLINVMTYDIHGGFEPITGHHSALYSSPYEPQNLPNPNISYNDPDVRKYWNAAASLQFFKNCGVEPEKICIGVPFYSRGWGCVRDNTGRVVNKPHQTKVNVTLPGLYADVPPSNTGTVFGQWDGGLHAAGCNPYHHVVTWEDKNPDGKGVFRKYKDPWAKVPYLYRQEDGIMYTYDDIESTRYKLDFVNRNNFGGCIIWDITGDGGFTKDQHTKAIVDGLYSNNGTSTISPNVGQLLGTGAINIRVQASGSINPDIYVPSIGIGQVTAPVQAPVPIKIGKNMVVTGIDPGTYSLFAETFVHNGVTYTATIDRESVNVSPGNVSDVTVTYSAGGGTVTPPAEGSVRFNVHAQGSFSATAQITALGKQFFIPTGSFQTEQGVAATTHQMSVFVPSDTNFSYSVSAPTSFTVNNGAQTVVDIYVTAIPHGGGGITPECYNASVDYREDMLHVLNVKLTNNSNQTINNWVIGFNFNNDIFSINPNVNFNRVGNSYTVQSNGVNPNFMPNSSIEFVIYFTKHVNDVLRDITINGKPICSALPPTPQLQAPTSLNMAGRTSNSINLAWGLPSNTANIQGYRIFRNNSLLTEVGPSQTTFNDTGLSPNTTYSYRVASFNGTTEASTSSFNFTTETAPLTLQPPTNLNVASKTSNSVNLAWNHPTNSATVQGYRIYRDNGLLTTVGAHQTTFSDTGLLPNTNYSYRVASYSGATEATTAALSVRTVELPSSGGLSYTASEGGWTLNLNIINKTGATIPAGWALEFDYTGIAPGYISFPAANISISGGKGRATFPVSIASGGSYNVSMSADPNTRITAVTVNGARAERQ